MSEILSLLPRPSPRQIAIGLAVAVVIVAGSIALGNYLTLPPVGPIQLSSAVDGCSRFWTLMNSEKNNRERDAEMLALSKAFEPVDDVQAARLRNFVRRGSFFGPGELADGFYRRCVNEHRWPPPTQEIADMRDPPESSAN